MKYYSFIDHGQLDFLKDKDDKTIIVKAESYEQAEDWLLKHGEHNGWTNKGTEKYCWNDKASFLDDQTIETIIKNYSIYIYE